MKASLSSSLVSWMAGCVIGMAGNGDLELGTETVCQTNVDQPNPH
jgi:hypothetical protein